MNRKVSSPISERCGYGRASFAARCWLLILTMLALSTLCAPAQSDLSEFARGKPAAQQIVSTNQLLTPEKAQKAAQRARMALLQGRDEEAQNQVKRALDIFPNCAIALTLQGIIEIDGRHYADAASAFRRAIDADPTLGVAYLGLGRTFNLLGRYKEALVPLDRATAFLPTAWLVYFEAALAHLAIGESDAGLKEITNAERLTRVDPLSHSALSYARGLAHVQLKDYRRAKADLEETIAHDPGGPWAMPARKTLKQLNGALTVGR